MFPVALQLLLFFKSFRTEAVAVGYTLVITLVITYVRRVSACERSRCVITSLLKRFPLHPTSEVGEPQLA